MPRSHDSLPFLQPLDDSFNDLRGTPVQIAVPMVAQSTGGKHGCTNGNIADGETESNACFDLSVLDHAPAEFKKRVSFGKIFRKSECYAHPLASEIVGMMDGLSLRSMLCDVWGVS